MDVIQSTAGNRAVNKTAVGTRKNEVAIGTENDVKTDDCVVKQVGT